MRRRYESRNSQARRGARSTPRRCEFSSISIHAQSRRSPAPPRSRRAHGERRDIEARQPQEPDGHRSVTPGGRHDHRADRPSGGDRRGHHARRRQPGAADPDRRDRRVWQPGGRGPSAAIVLAAVPPRDGPRDALVARDGAKLADLPAGARIGTGSPRRAAQLLGLRADLRCVPIRGNANTRVGKVEDGELDGVVLACAGLVRIGFVSAITQVFEPEEMLPAPGQGALAVECRADERELAALLEAVTDQASMPAVTAERSLLEALEAGCSAPVGAYAAGLEQLQMRAAVMSTDGSRVLRARGAGPGADAGQLGRALAAELLQSGAGDLISVPQAPTSSGNDVQ